VAAERRFGRFAAVVGACDEHDLAAQLAAPLLEVAVACERSDDDLGADRAVRARRPGNRNRTVLHEARCDEPRAHALERPAATELERLGVYIDEPPALEAFLRPPLGEPHLRRVREPAADS